MSSNLPARDSRGRFVSGGSAVTEKRDFTLSEMTDDLRVLFAGPPTASGVSVTPNNALTINAVYSAVQVISEAVAQLPINLFRRLDDGNKVIDTVDPLYRVLRFQPNAEMTPFEFWQFMMLGVLLRGNGFAQIQRNNAGQIAALWPLHPEKVVIVRGPDDRLVYQYHSGTQTTQFAAEDVMHLRGMSHDGVVGLSPIDLQRESLGLTKAMEQYDARFFGNSAMPGIVLKSAQKMTPEVQKAVVETWNEHHQGVRRSQKAGILGPGMDIEQIGFSPEDSQLLESRKFQIDEVARMFKLPPHKIGSLERATFNNVEQQELNFLTQTLAPWLNRIEQAIWRDLIGDETRFVDFDTASMLKADVEGRSKANATGLQNGYLSINEVRQQIGLNPVAGGDSYVRQLNLTSINSEVEDEEESAPAGRATELRLAVDNSVGTVEERSLHITAVAHRPMFVKVAEDILAVEAAGVRTALADDGFKPDNVNLFYDNHSVFVDKKIRGALEVYADEVRNTASDQMGDVNVSIFLERYIEGAVARWITQSRVQILKSLESGTPSDSVARRLQEWSDTRPERFALRETVQGAGAIGKEVYKSLGFKSLRWKTLGEGPQELDGKQVKIDEHFAARGESVGDNEAKSNIGHPPFGPGDESIIEPVTG